MKETNTRPNVVVVMPAYHAGRTLRTTYEELPKDTVSLGILVARPQRLSRLNGSAGVGVVMAFVTLSMTEVMIAARVDASPRMI